MRIGNAPPTPPYNPISPIQSSWFPDQLRDAFNRVHNAMSKIYSDIHSTPPASADQLNTDLAALNDAIDGKDGLQSWLNYCSDPKRWPPPQTLPRIQAETCNDAISSINKKMQDCVTAAEKSPPDVVAADKAYYGAGDALQVFYQTIWPQT